MKLILIRMPALLPVLLLSSQIVLAADPVPKFDISRSCRSAGATSGMATRDRAACEHDENNARAALEKEWSQVSPPDKPHCVRLVTLGGSPSYVELLTCLEMAKGSKEHPADQMDSGKPVEKSRHSK
jgi:hypothetical protein